MSAELERPVSFAMWFGGEAGFGDGAGLRWPGQLHTGASAPSTSTIRSTIVTTVAARTSGVSRLMTRETVDCETS